MGRKRSKLDCNGRRTDCHFYNVSGIRATCVALKDFYNVEDSKNQCGKCTFFMTDDEFYTRRAKSKFAIAARGGNV